MNEWDMFQDGWPDGEYGYGYMSPELIAANRAAVEEEKKRKTIDKLTARGKYTPDFAKLRLFDNILVFVYDELKQNGDANKYLKDSPFLGEARTSHNHFVMKSAPRGPVVFNNSKTEKRGFVRGECYAVSPETLLDLDYVMSNQHVFRREEKYIFLMDQEYKTKNGQRRPSVKAWTYLGVPEFWMQQSLLQAPRTIPHGNKGQEKGYYEFYCYKRSVPTLLRNQPPYGDHMRWTQ